MRAFIAALLLIIAIAEVSSSRSKKMTRHRRITAVNEDELEEGKCFWRGAFLDLEIQAMIVTSETCRTLCREQTGSDGSCFFSDCLCDFNGAPYLPTNVEGRVF